MVQRPDEGDSTTYLTLFDGLARTKMVPLPIKRSNRAYSQNGLDNFALPGIGDGPIDSAEIAESDETVEGDWPPW
jgi:hypothetical protein